MKISAGMLITDSDHILICHVTGSKKFDIPIEACIRETLEETNLGYKKNRLKDLLVTFSFDTLLKWTLLSIIAFLHTRIIEFLTSSRIKFFLYVY